MPVSSNAHEEWNKERFIKWANEIGVSTVEVITNLFTQYKYEQQGYNGAKSILMLASKYSKERLENACRIALAHISHPRYKNIKAILENKQDMAEEPIKHDRTVEKTFLRGADYYKGGDCR
jgi:ERCC4-related helicase